MSSRQLARAQRMAFAVGIAFLLLSLPQAVLDYGRFLQSYLFAYLFWLELSLGSMAMLMLYCLTKGGWGAVTRRILEASTRTLYVTAIFFLPILVGVKHLYPWAHDSMFASGLLPHKSVYFDLIFFYARSVFYFLSWLLTAYFLDHALNQKDGGSTSTKAIRLSACALVIFGLTVTGAAIDWQMSLDPLWRSTIYGMIFAIGQAFGAWAFTLLILRLLLAAPSNNILIPIKTERDLGSLLLTLVILWAYLSFMQYLIVWSGNLPDEVTWFGKRTRHGWQWLLLLLLLFQFAAPFAALLFRSAKASTTAMILLTISILIVRILDRYWMIMPSFYPDGISIAYTDLTLVIGLGGLWLGGFLWYLNRRAIFFVNDPNWPEP